MIEVKLYSYLKNLHSDVVRLDHTQFKYVENIVDMLKIEKKDTILCLINGVKSHLDNAVYDGDIVSLYPIATQEAKDNDSLKKVYIEPTTNCNFSCAMCFRNAWFDETFQDMPFDVFLTALDGIPKSAKTIMLGGVGEPLVHPNIHDMIFECKKRGFIVELLTNASLLDDSMIDKLFTARLDTLWISLDTLRPHNTSANIGHPDAQKVIENINRLNKLRMPGVIKYKKTPDVGIALVISEYNINELQHLPSFIAKHRISYVNISNIRMDNEGDANKQLYTDTLNKKIGSENAEMKFPIVNIPYMDFSRDDVKNNFASLLSQMNFILHINNIPLPRKTQYCRFVEEGMVFIRSDGNVSPCMELLHNSATTLGTIKRTIHHHSFGNIKNQSIADIWESMEYRDFRTKVKEFSFSPCIYCGHCGYTESNLEDCYGNKAPTCGACLWSEGLFSCP